MIDKYCRKSGPLGYKVELTFYHIWICKFLTCSVSKRNVKDFFYTSKCLADDVKVALATFFLGEFTSSANSMSLNNMVWYNSPRKKLLKQLLHQAKHLDVQKKKSFTFLLKTLQVKNLHI